MKPESLDANLERRAFVKNLPSYLLNRVQGVFNRANGIPARGSVAESNFVGARFPRPHDPTGEVTPRFARDCEKPAPPLQKVARINVERCLAWSNALCQACYLACPLRDRALEIIDQKPIINISVCDGCGYCLTACQTVNDQVAVELVMNDVRGGD